MKKFKFYLAAAILSLSVLSGCGMVEDGYIEDDPRQTIAPVETPAVTIAPQPAKKPAEKDKEEDAAVEETPAQDPMQTSTPNI